MFCEARRSEAVRLGSGRAERGEEGVREFTSGAIEVAVRCAAAVVEIV
jgi:hypothetical protein